jgi:hypothetical protein
VFFGVVVFTMFFTFLCFLFVISLLKIAPKPSAKVVSKRPERKKAANFLMEEMQVLGNFCSGMLNKTTLNMLFSAVDCEVSVN